MADSVQMHSSLNIGSRCASARADNNKSSNPSTPSISSFDSSSSNLCVKESETLKAIQNYFPFIYRINDGFTTNTILMRVCKERGWKEFAEKDLRNVGADVVGWNLWWRCSVMNKLTHQYRFQMLYSWQYTNHIPNAFFFCKKSNLTVYLRSMRHTHGNCFDFYPTSFVLPNEYPQFLAEHCRRSDTDIEDARNVIRVSKGSTVYRTPIWISKPNGKSQGKGIVIFNELKLLQYSSPSVLQEYIARPMLIGGYKFDLRLYACVASSSPLNIYLYHEGLTRFATTKYNLEDIDCTFSHLTNSSINKSGPGYNEVKNEIGTGCKWSLRRLRQYFATSPRVDTDWFLWQKIATIVILTIVGEAGKTPAYSHKKNCFNVFGFDILIDEDFKPWLLEVNLSPGLGGDCEVDNIVKRPMLHDLFNLLGFPDCSEFVQMVENNERSNDAKLVQKSKEVKNSVARPNTASNPRPVTFCTYNNVKKTKKYPTQYPWGPRTGTFESLNLESISTKMIDRLKSLQAIYGKHLSLDGKSNYIYKPKNSSNTEVKSKRNQVLNPQSNNKCSSHVVGNALLKEFWNAIPGVNKDVSLSPHRPGIGIRHRNWHEPVKREGGWVRIFPFNSGIEMAAKGSKSTSVKIKEVVAETTCFLRAAEEMVTKFPRKPDDYYNKYLHRSCRFNTEIWLPPL